MNIVKDNSTLKNNIKTNKTKKFIMKETKDEKQELIIIVSRGKLNFLINPPLLIRELILPFVASLKKFQTIIPKRM
jgi:hypothetical protein|tara:strand:+ start:564 stop:791 length:228 start_codon:yes stop_codon:yes gene_type:complete